ncbi:hypothetical protein [uncultured Paraglaciecola sp.]|uniref:hypothetical protein n=1 Tax=uncultured Paraglaciecola sp. TaxID=1765024 RepID=UPI0025978ABA|nr:hypothetical protein [uncultured Paraglaciecola sp.]
MFFQKFNFALLLCFISFSDAYAENIVLSNCNDPVSCGIYEQGTTLAKIADNFNSGSASKRIFSEMHYYIGRDPHLTIGFGHWARKGLDGFFHTMYRNTNVWSNFIGTACSWLIEHPEHYIEFIKDTGIDADFIDSNSCRDGLLNLLLGKAINKNKSKLESWSNTITKERPNVFNEGSDHWFRKVVTLSITTNSGKLFQAAHWANSVASSGEKKAKVIELHSLGGIATLASADSSGWGTVKHAYNAILHKKPRVIKHKDIKVRDKIISIGKSLSYPTFTVPADLVNHTVELQVQLSDWHAVVLWQEYRSYKTDERRTKAANDLGSGQTSDRLNKRLDDLSYTRSRMKNIWNRYFFKTWGPIPKDAATFPTKHSGIAMMISSLEEELKILNKLAEYEKN